MIAFERNIVGREWDGVHSAASAVEGITINMLCRREVGFFFFNFKLDLRDIKDVTLLFRTRFTCVSIEDCFCPRLRQWLPHLLSSNHALFSGMWGKPELGPSSFHHLKQRRHADNIGIKGGILPQRKFACLKITIQSWPSVLFRESSIHPLRFGFSVPLTVHSILNSFYNIWVLKTRISFAYVWQFHMYIMYLDHIYPKSPPLRPNFQHVSLPLYVFTFNFVTQ